MDSLYSTKIQKQQIKKGCPWQNYIEICLCLCVIRNLNDSENCQMTCIMWTWDDQ
jgi:hypothetical protein